MDCEKFEANLIDELYEELDELTSAAVKRHVAGCSRCASILGGLRATRRVAVLPMVEPPVDLEDRILAAARNAQKVVPIRRRFSRAVSLAGAWAMRPQTAMAAVFVLMVGSSLLFVRRGKVAANDSLTVTAQGQPVPAGAASAASESQPVDSKAAAAAHGVPQAAGGAVAAAPAATAAPSPMASAAPQEEQLAYGSDREGAMLPKGKARSMAPGANPFGDPSSDGLGASNAGIPGGAPVPFPSKNEPPLPSDLDRVTQAPPVAPVAQGASRQSFPRSPSRPSDVLKSNGGAGGGGQAPQAQASQAPAQHASWGPDLQAAIGTEGANGCGMAASLYDQVAQRQRGTSDGNEAQYRAAECYRRIGRSDMALPRYQALTEVPAYASRANAGVAVTSSPDQVATRAAPSKKAAAKPSAPAAPPPPQSTSAPQQQAAPTTPTQAY
jgi:hypothetical protein